MALEVITREDLHDFRLQLLEDFKKLLQPHKTEQKQWLKGTEVRQLLKISPGTLQNLRVNGTLTYTKIGGILFYSSQGIDAVMQGNMINSPNSERK
jgi:hypothetical protein